MHPYWDKDFFEFFLIFFKRVYLFLVGQLSVQDLVSDEIQFMILLMIGISGAILGCLIVSRKMSMLANSLSHTILLGIVLSYFMMMSFTLAGEKGYFKMDYHILILAACITALITTFLSNWLHRLCRLQEDASVGFVFTTFFALGLTMLTLFFKDNHIGTEAIMGNIDATVLSDLKGLFFVMILNLSVIFLFFKEMKVTTFDPIFAGSVGISSGLMSYILMFLTSLTSVFAFKVVGVFLFLGFLVSPILAARILAKSLKQLMVFACLFSMISALISVALTRHCLTFYGVGLSSSAVVTLCLALCFPIMIAIRYIRSKIQLPSTVMRLNKEVISGES